MSTRDTDAAARFLRDNAPPPEGALLGRIALEMHLLSHEQLQGALRYLEQERAAGREIQLGQVLLKFRYLTAEDLGCVLEEQRRRQETATTIRDEGRPQPGARIGSYEIVEEIGRGAMGFVYKAFDPKLKRTVAIKTVREDRCDAAFLERFQREAVALARLHHPGIVTLYEAGMHRGLPFVAMELVEGKSLEERLRRGRIPFGDAARIAEAAARAVHHAHGEGVIHRDLKPGNILLDRDEHPRIVDFGLARVESDRIAMTMSGDVLGTPAYMSPEQVKGSRKLIDARTDVYALGAILYEMLTGKMPFTGRTAAELFDKILRSEPPPPRRFRTIPRDLEVLCLKAMAKEPQRRYASAELLAEDLRRFQAGEPIHARPPSVWYRVRNRLPRHKAVIAACLVGALFTVVLVPRLIREIRSRREKERELDDERTTQKTTTAARTRAQSYVDEGSRAYTQLRLLQRERRQVDPEDCRRVSESALDLFSKALAEVPGMPEAYLGIAKVHGAKHETELALATLEKAIAAAPALSEAYLERIRMRISEIHFVVTDGVLDRPRSAGLPELARAIEADVGKVHLYSTLRADLLFARGIRLFLSGEVARAVEDLGELLRITPEDAATWRIYSMALSEVGEYGKAEEALGQSISRSSFLYDGKHYLVRAGLRRRQGKMREAIEDLGEYIAQNPAEPAGYQMRASCLAVLSKYPEALADASKAIELDAKDADTRILRGKILARFGRPQEAIPDFTRALELCPTSAEAFAGRGAAHALLGDRVQGMADLTEAIRLDPNLAEAHMNRGYCRVQERDFEGAAHDFDRALELEPQLPGAHRNRGFLRLSLKQWAEAVADFDQALELDPQDVKARLGRAQARAWCGDRPGAAEDARKALQLGLPPEQRREMESLLSSLGEKP